MIDSALPLAGIMASADSCPHPSRHVAIPLVWLFQTDEQVSQGKTRLFPPGLAGFTKVCVRMVIGRRHPLLACPATPAFYPVSVRRVRLLPPASSRPRLAATPLLLASNSHHQGLQGDLHPLDPRHAWHTKSWHGRDAHATKTTTSNQRFLERGAGRTFLQKGSPRFFVFYFSCASTAAKAVMWITSISL